MHEYRLRGNRLVKIFSSPQEPHFLRWKWEIRPAALDPAPTGQVERENIDYIVWCASRDLAIGRETNGRYFLVEYALGSAILVALDRALFVASAPERFRSTVLRMLEAIERRRTRCASTA